MAKKALKPVVKLTTVRLDAGLLRRARIWALNHDTTFQKMLADALEQYMRGGK